MKPFVGLLPCSKYITVRGLTAEAAEAQDLEASLHSTTFGKPPPRAFC